MIVTLAAGESQNITIAGARFYFVTGDGKINLKIKGSGDSRDFDLYPRMGIDSDQRFSGVEIRNIHDAEQTVEFEISDRGVFDNRIPEVTQIEPLGGQLPVEIIAPQTSIIRCGGNISASVAAEAVACRLAFDAVWGDRVFLAEAVGVSLIGPAWAEDLVIGLSYSAQITTGGIYGAASCVAESFGADREPSLGLSAEYEWGSVAPVDYFVTAYDRVVTSTTKAMRNVHFDLSNRPYRIETPGAAFGGLGVFIQDLAGVAVADGSAVSQFFATIYGRFINE